MESTFFSKCHLKACAAFINIRRPDESTMVSHYLPGQRQACNLAPYVDRSRLGFVLFGEDGATGATMQAMTLPICPQS